MKFRSPVELFLFTCSKTGFFFSVWRLDFFWVFELDGSNAVVDTIICKYDLNFTCKPVANVDRASVSCGHGLCPPAPCGTDLYTKHIMKTWLSLKLKWDFYVAFPFALLRYYNMLLKPTYRSESLVSLNINFFHYPCRNQFVCTMYLNSWPFKRKLR